MFYLMGGPMLKTENSCIAEGIRAIDVRHEQAAAMMAHAYSRVLQNALHRTCRKWGITCTDAEGLRYYEAVPTWGPHPDVTAGLAKIAGKIPLVILSNAANDQIQKNVALLQLCAEFGDPLPGFVNVVG